MSEGNGTQAGAVISKAEEEFMSALMSKPERACEIADVVRPEFLTEPAHRLIYSTVLKLIGETPVVDHTAITGRLTAEQLFAIGGRGWFVKYELQSPTEHQYLAHRARVLSSIYMSRRIGLGMNEVAACALQEPLNGAQHYESAERVLYEIGSMTQPDNLVLPDEWADAEQPHLDSPDHRGSGVPTGLADLDGLLGGLEKGHLVVVGARPSIGKSTLGLVISYNLTVTGKRVAFFSLEMDARTVYRRLATIHSGLSLTVWIKNTFNRSERAEAQEASNAIRQLPIAVDATHDASVMRMRSVIRKLSRREPLDCVIVDYLQLVKPLEGSSRVEQVGSISRGLKLLAREFDIPVVAAAQLNRKADDHSEPVLSDLRESGSIEADADVVIFIHRPNKRDDSALSEVARLIVAKNRNGPCLGVDVLFDQTAVRFRDYEKVRMPK